MTLDEALARIAELEREVARLREALRDLLSVIETDELIPESVSYMRQARQALRG